MLPWQAMTAAEIIELIKKLPPEEKAEVIAFLQEKQAGVAEPTGIYDAAERPVRYIAKDEFEKIAPKIFEDNRELLRRLAQ